RSRVQKRLSQLVRSVLGGLLKKTLETRPLRPVRRLAAVRPQSKDRLFFYQKPLAQPIPNGVDRVRSGRSVPHHEGWGFQIHRDPASRLRERWTVLEGSQTQNRRSDVEVAR